MIHVALETWNMELTDTHCHLDYNKFDDDRAAVIQRAQHAGLIRILVPGLDHVSSKEAVRLAESHSMIYAAVGFHPTDLDQFNDETFDQVIELSSHPKIVAIGEIGIDYYWVKEEDKRAFQREALNQQLTFAETVNKPVVIHMREENDVEYGEASEDILNITNDWHKRLTALNHPLANRPGVFHSFNGNLETAQRALEMNFYIGLTGPITYKKADKNRELVAQLPLERLLIETDAPFLTPVPHRGKRNEPAYVRHIADKIAEIHSKDPGEIAAITTANAARLFSWGD